MQKKLHFLIVDDNELILRLHKNLLENAGHKVTTSISGKQALQQIRNTQPDCVLSDLLIPDLDGFSLFQKTREIKKIKQPTFIIVTIKSYDFDRRQALGHGIDGYLTKPINESSFVDDVLGMINGTMVVEFWGVRGTLPVPGEKTNIYGGNTNCITLTFAKKNLFIFDAGTGIKELSNYLLEKKMFPLSAKIFISHTHYDHINGLPFFVPFYMQGNEFEIFGVGYGNTSIDTLIANQMDSPYFPITLKEFAAKINFKDLSEESFFIDTLHIETIFLNHPGNCLGYKVRYKNKIFCYITDNELYLKNNPSYNEYEEDKLVKFIEKANLLVIDTTYSDEEYIKKVGWGHSCVSRVVEIAHRAQVKKLCLYHHDPDQYDMQITEKLRRAKSLLKELKSKTKCIAPREGDKITI